MNRHKKSPSNFEGLFLWLELIWYLNDADHDFMRIAIFIQQTEFHHGIVFFQLCLHIDNLIIE